MTITELLPVDPSTDNPEIGRIGLIPIDDATRFSLTGTEFEGYSALADVISDKVGEIGVVGFELHGTKLLEELVKHKQDGALVLSLVSPRRTDSGLVSGSAYDFVRHPDYQGVTFFEQHHFYRSGVNETHTTPLPMDQFTGQVISKVLGRIFGPGIIPKEVQQ